MAISSRPGTEASIPAATWPISPGWASWLVAAAAALAAACACAITCLHCAVAACAQTSGIRGLARAARALLAAPQVMSRQKATIASAVPQTSGLTSLRNSATSSHNMRVLFLDDLQEPVLQARQLDGHRLGDDTARGQRCVHVPAAVVLDQELAVQLPSRPAGQQPASDLVVRRIDLHPDPPPDRAQPRGRALLDDPAQAQSMVAASWECPGLLGIAYYRRLYPKLRHAKALIAAGAIGRPVLAQACNHGWLESEERSWLRDPALAGGGPLYDSGSHRLDAFNFLFGKPARATGLLSNVVHRLGVEDSATVLVDYESGVRGVLDSRWNSRIVRDEFRVIGTEGEMDLTPLNGPELRYGGKVEILPACVNLHYPLIENFVAAVLDGDPLVCPAADAIWVDWITEEVKQAC